jgi:hypothetical protein
VHLERAGRLAAHAVEAVAAGDVIAVERLLPAVADESDPPLVHTGGGGLEEDGPSVGEPAGDEVLHHLVLAVDGDRLAGQLLEGDAVRAAVEADLERRVHHALAVQARGDPGGVEDVDGALLEHPGADARLDVLAAGALEDDRLDAAQVQEVRQDQPGRTGADDANLGAHRLGSYNGREWSFPRQRRASGPTSPTRATGRR